MPASGRDWSAQTLRLTQERTERIFEDLQRTVHVQTDRLFAILMTAQWIFGIVAALVISPRTWAGSASETSVHVWAAIVLGGAISGFPVALALLRPGERLTRHSIAVGQMLTSALLIHLTGGRIETHFHVFGSLAFLAFYRDWTVLIPATVVVAADHFARGLWWPESVYGVLTASQWRFLEHAGWVVFEDIVLVASCIRGTRELRKFAERSAEFETSEHRYQAIVDQAPDGILVFDAQSSEILEHNPGFLRLIDGPVNEPVGIDDELMPGDEPLGEVVESLVRDGMPRVIERGLRRRSGEVLEVACSLSLTRYAGRQAVCAVVRDVTDQKRLEVAMERARDAALESARLKAEFLANMSHEIRTPMNGVIGMTGLLLDTPLNEEQREFAETIRSSGESLLTIINDVLDFSKIEAGKLQFETLDFDLRHALEGAAELLIERAMAKNLELAVHVDDEVPTALRGDQGRLRQVLVNLIGNAIKFTETGEVIVRASLVERGLDDAVVRIVVQDTGIGLPEHAQERLFQAFTQADGSTTRRYGGTGLGLAICRRLVELMGGKIGVTSKVGAGSTFWFTARFGLQSNSSNETESLGGLQGRRVLVVDDNATNRRILQHQLSRWAVDHSSADGAESALRMLRAAAESGRPFELVILDRQMPEVDGLALAAMIRADALIQNVAAVMLTSLGRHDAVALAELGIDIHLTKPVKQAQLYECLTQALDAKVPSRRTPPPTPALAQQEPSKARVLVAEDNVVNQKVIQLLLARLGYGVDLVANGMEAIDALSRIRYDVVLMDWQMPELDGFETTRRIRSHEGGAARIPIIAMTASALVGDREACLEAGMDDYLTKPIKTSELQEVMERWTATKRPTALLSAAS
jgi:PAS domain S-box-containing protein